MPDLHVATGAAFVGLIVGLAVGDARRRHLRRINTGLVTDIHRERTLRNQWVKVAEDRVRAQPPDARDWVRRSEVIRLAHIAEQAEAVAAENVELRRQLTQQTGGDR